jgi:hypothetical protein
VANDFLKTISDLSFAASPSSKKISKTLPSSQSSQTPNLTYPIIQMQTLFEDNDVDNLGRGKHHYSA